MALKPMFSNNNALKTSYAPGMTRISGARTNSLSRRLLAFAMFNISLGIGSIATSYERGMYRIVRPKEGGKQELIEAKRQSRIASNDGPLVSIREIIFRQYRP